MTARPTIAPEIRTARLLLRPHRRADFEGYAAIFSSERSRYMGGPLSLQDAWFSFAGDVGNWGLFGFGAWAIEIAESGPEQGAFAGQVCIAHPAHFPEIELGWMVLPGFEGQGIAFEAAQAALRWAEGRPEIGRLVSYIDPENARSIRLAQRLGASLDASAPAPDPTDLVYRHRLPAALEGAA